MPRAISPEAPIDALEDEILYTGASLKADPEAQDVAPDFSTLWLQHLDELRKDERAVRAANLETNAQRAIANVRLDARCEHFGDTLLLEVGKDRNSPRWKGFFPVPVSSFVRQPFADQVQQMTGWLSSSDPALATHLPELTRWLKASKLSLDQDSDLALTRSAHKQRREAFAAAFTEARDALHDQLSSLAREKKLGRLWADAFFMRG